MPSDGTEAAYRRTSFWHATVPGSLVPRPALRGKVRADVAIVGAGYTGLWTALSLASADPSLRIAVVEREIAGFGASGRNGGWVSASFPASKARIAAEHGRDAAIAMQRAMFHTVDEVGRACEAERIDACFRKAGSLGFAVDRPQADRFHATVEEERAFGFGEGDVTWLDADDARSRVDVAGALGALWTPHCASVHPARLARGLAEAVERRGVQLFERTPATVVERGLLRTPEGSIRADVVVWATEGYGGGMPERHRIVAPVYTHMLATEPLPQAFWDEVGWAGRECVWDGPRLFLYAQRTADDRIAIGGGFVRYPFASRVRPAFDRPPAVFRAIRRVITERWPAAAGARITHRWGGAIGVPRDWFPSVGIDRSSGVAWAGGYAGDGVATANLAGRTLADLILDRDTELVRLPWVGHRSPRWEPEPLRWLGVGGTFRLMQLTDAVERRTGRTPRLLEAVAQRVMRTGPGSKGERS